MDPIDREAHSGTKHYDAGAIARVSAIALAVVILAIVAWQLMHVLLLLFAAVLFAVILRSIAALIGRIPGVGEGLSLFLAVVLLVALVGGFFFLLGSQLQTQVATLVEKIPQLVTAAGDRLGIDNLQQRLMQRAESFSPNGLIARMGGYTSSVLNGATSFVLVLAAGVYLAARPHHYRHGAIVLLPRHWAGEARRLFDNVGHALRLWLLAQLASMAFLGLFITTGYYLIGLPSALALGVLAGVLAFVPIVGVLLALLPAVLVGLAESTSMALWVLALFAVAQLLEEYLVLPLAQRKAVELPPVVTIFAIVAFGTLFGPLGIVLGTPLAVMFYVSINQLYIRDALGKATQVPGEHHG